MIVIGGPDWQSAFGLSAIVEEAPFQNKTGQEKVRAHFIKKANALGKRVAAFAKRLKHYPITSL